MMYGRRPLTRLEAGLFAGLVAIFIAIFVRQMLEYMELAERAAMEATLLNAVSGINTRRAEDLLAPRNAVADWKRRNPFELARMAPANFAGELDGLLPPSGSWGYDSSNGELIYAPRLHFKLNTPNGSAVLRFHLTATAGGGYMLVPNTPYRWE